MILMMKMNLKEQQTQMKMMNMKISGFGSPAIRTNIIISNELNANLKKKSIPFNFDGN